MIEFFVFECQQVDGATILAGVVNLGVVKIGTVFDAATGESVEKTSSEPGSSVRLSVTRIVTYGHQVDELHQGMTGELVVEGDGLGELQHGRFVSSK